MGTQKTWSSKPRRDLNCADGVQHNTRYIDLVKLHKGNKKTNGGFIIGDKPAI
jgi:hypothetical protein